MKDGWQPLDKTLKALVPTTLHPWLFQANNLTLVLKQYCQEHEFERIELNTAQPFTQTEQNILDETQGYLRRIAHKVNGQRVIYARVAFPKTTFELMQKKSEDWGKNPLVVSCMVTPL